MSIEYSRGMEGEYRNGLKEVWTGCEKNIEEIWKGYIQVWKGY